MILPPVLMFAMVTLLLHGGGGGSPDLEHARPNHLVCKGGRGGGTPRKIPCMNPLKDSHYFVVVIKKVLPGHQGGDLQRWLAFPVEKLDPNSAILIGFSCYI